MEGGGKKGWMSAVNSIVFCHLDHQRVSESGFVIWQEKRRLWESGPDGSGSETGIAARPPGCKDTLVLNVTYHLHDITANMAAKRPAATPVTPPDGCF